MLFPHAHSLTEVYAISGNYTPYCMYRLPASRSEAHLSQRARGYSAPPYPWAAQLVQDIRIMTGCVRMVDMLTHRCVCEAEHSASPYQSFVQRLLIRV